MGTKKVETLIPADPAATAERFRRRAEKALQEADDLERLLAAMKKHGAAKVGDLPPKVLEEILGPGWREILGRPAE